MTHVLHPHSGSAGSGDRGPISAAVARLTKRLRHRFNHRANSAIGGAIARDEFFLTYQPKLDLRKRTIDSVEALIRWEDPDRGTIHPNDFIPDAEQNGDILPLSNWVLHRAISDQIALRKAGHDLTVYVNIAAPLLNDAAFIERAATGVALSGARIGFEITETSVIHDPEAAIENLRKIRSFGIDIAIDDYGAGLSSLAYLKRLPACELKIDKLFITELGKANRDPLIVRSTIDLAHALEMRVVAEGVEDQAVLALLAIMGCDLAQGYLISKPKRLEALLDVLNAKILEGLSGEVATAGLNMLRYK